MIRGLLGLVRLAFVCIACGLALLAIGGALGFASPYLDLINHLQLVLFGSLLAALLLTPLLIRTQPWHGFVLATTATGLIASSVIVVPEALSALARDGAQHIEGTHYRLMTHNLFGVNDDMEAVAAQIFAVDPDILALQEYFPEQSEPLHPVLLERYPYFVQCAGGRRAFIGLYAKLPFESRGGSTCAADAASGGRTALILAHFAPEGGPAFSVMTTHLDWPLPVGRQIREFAELRDAVRASDGTLVLAGDFNSTPWSYAMRSFVKEAGLTRHTFNLLTYPTLWHYLDDWRPTFPVLALDHIMGRGPVGVSAVRLGQPAGSDHLPVIADLVIGAQ